MRPPLHPPRLPLRPARHLIDRIDEGLLLLVGARRLVVASLASTKRHAGVALDDPQREQVVRVRARRVGARLELPPGLTRSLIGLLINDARAQQGLGPPNDAIELAENPMPEPPKTNASEASGPDPGPDWRQRLLAGLPPPRRLAPLLGRLPHRLQARLIEAVVARALAGPLATGALDFMQGRRLGIEASDLGLTFVFEMQNGRLQLAAPGSEAEASVRGSATDLLLLSSRLEDADALFFQRRLELTGDTELGLTARNLLDALPWEEVPLGLRILLNRAARLARAARAAHHARGQHDHSARSATDQRPAIPASMSGNPANADQGNL